MLKCFYQLKPQRGREERRQTIRPTERGGGWWGSPIPHHISFSLCTSPYGCSQRRRTNKSIGREKNMLNRRGREGRGIGGNKGSTGVLTTLSSSFVIPSFLLSLFFMMIILVVMDTSSAPSQVSQRCLQKSIRMNGKGGRGTHEAMYAFTQLYCESY